MPFPRIDPNDPNCSVSAIRIANVQNGEVEIEVKENAFVIEMGENPCRIKYETRPGPKAKLDNNIVLKGELLGSSREYPINIDTGVWGYVLLNDIHVLENTLPTYSSPDGQDGICCLPDLRIGELILSNPVAKQYFRHSELQLFRLLIEKNKEIMIGLSLLQRFKYVAFDHARKEAEFSTAQSFPTQDRDSWSGYPFSIQADSQGNPRILVDIPIGGQNMQLMFDTGCDPALLTSESIWKQTQERLRRIKKSIKTVYAPFAGRNIRSRTVVVRELQVGDNTVKNAYVCILPNEGLNIGPVKSQGGLLGMQCFADTIVVLDFEREVMWVKNNEQ